jgi:hypothetical protein
MSDVPETPEVPEDRRDDPFTIRVAVTMSILAVLVAIATLLGHRAGTEEVILQTKAADQWAYYQAKNIRLREVQSAGDMLATLMPADKQKAEALQEKYQKEAERYQDEKDDASEKAQDFEKERDVAGRREDRYDAGEVVLEIGLIICSLTLLTRRRIFWYSGMILGVAGFCVTLSAFLLH